MFGAIRASLLALVFSLVVPGLVLANGTLSSLQTDHAGALAEVNEALKANKSDRGLLVRKGELLIQSGKLDEAVRFHKWLVRKFPDEPVARNNLGVAYQAGGDLEQALKQFRKTTKKHPGFALAHENTGNLLTAMASAAFTAASLADDTNQAVAAKAKLSASLDLLAQESLDLHQSSQAAALDSKPIGQRVVNTMHSWINAWNAKDLNTWLSHYSTKFQPDNDRSVEEWVERSKRNFEKSDYFKVYLDNLVMSQVNNGLVSVRFRELFESDAFESVSEKEILMKQERGAWLIVSENTL